MDNKLGTKCVHAGYTAKNGQPTQMPIIQSTTFKYDSCEQIADLFNLKTEGYFYSRVQNPTNDMVADKICALEGGSAAILTSSGQAANFFAIFNIATCGDHIVSSTHLYGGTHNLFSTTLKKMGIECTFVSPYATDAEIQKAFLPNTKAMFGESLSNPTLSVLDIERWAKIAHKNNVPLIIDNTFATPINCRPFEWGCDIVTHSTTKYLDGHAATIGGCIVDSGNFDWRKNSEKFPCLCEPDSSYHNIIYAEEFGNKMAYITKCSVQLMRDLGATQSPQNAFYLNLGIESLHVRIKRHCENAKKIADYLSTCKEIAWVNYPGLKSNEHYETEIKYFPNDSSGIMSFGFKNGFNAAKKFLSNLKIASIETHVADSKTCCLQPASSTHSQLNEEELKNCGITPDMIRLSCGLEDCQDLIDDIKQALKA